MTTSNRRDEKSHSDRALVRPAALAELLLASGDLLPRKRARDQQADLTGLALKRQMLNLLLSFDPEPEEIDQALERCVEVIGPPPGPARAIALSILEEWRAAQQSPEYIRWLLDQAVLESNGPRERKRRRARTQESD